MWRNGPVRGRDSGLAEGDPAGRASGDMRTDGSFVRGGEVALVISAPARPARGQDLGKTFFYHHGHAAEPL